MAKWSSVLTTQRSVACDGFGTLGIDKCAALGGALLVWGQSRKDPGNPSVSRPFLSPLRGRLPGRAAGFPRGKPLNVRFSVGSGPSFQHLNLLAHFVDRR